MSIGARAFADGALGANNPVDEVEGEASNIWCEQTGELKPLVKCFISIGTGSPGSKAYEDSLLKLIFRTVLDIATQTDSIEAKFIARWQRLFEERRYFRLNVDQGLQGIGLDEYKMKGRIESVTARYLTHTERKVTIRSCIQNLSLKQSMYIENLYLLIFQGIIRLMYIENADISLSTLIKVSSMLLVALT